ncbi:MAG: MBL fold metallo-hydrolase [Chloroflexota bacterium]
MKVKYLAHASFLITSDSGTRIITDPYTADERMRYGEIHEAADIVTVSHDHFDHSNVAAVRGKPQVVRGTAQAEGIKFTAVAAHHDEAGGGKRGNDTIFCFEVDGVRVCHLGDLGHLLGDKQVSEIGRVDVLFIPVGGFYTIDAGAATRVCRQLRPRVIIPMHFKTERTSLPIAGVDEFLSGKNNVVHSDGSEASFKAGALPAETQIIVLKPAL